MERAAAAPLFGINVDPVAINLSDARARALIADRHGSSQAMARRMLCDDIGGARRAHADEDQHGQSARPRAARL